MMVDPTVLLLDEPTAGLAPRFEDIVWDRLRAICSGGVAVVMVDQNTRRALSLGDWGYVLADGQNLREGPAKDLSKDAELVDLYIGNDYTAQMLLPENAC
jgi:branched-chain amino acid transport system ATP-binding protein